MVRITITSVSYTHLDVYKRQRINTLILFSVSCVMNSVTIGF